MSTSMRKCIATALTVAAGLVVLVTTGLLTVDFVAARRRLPDEKARVDDLVEMVRTSADHAEELHTEWDRLTDNSLQREQKQQSLSTILALAAVVFVLRASRSRKDPSASNPNLTPCPGCGNYVSRQAPACPKCGEPLSPEQDS